MKTLSVSSVAARILGNTGRSTLLTLTKRGALIWGYKQS